MKVYVSSTLTDLADHRRAVYEAIESIDLEEYVELHVVRTEDLVAFGKPPLSLLLSELEKAWLFILLLGWRYGYVPEGEDKSVAEIEYEKAKEARCTILCFIADDSHPVEAKFVETGANATKLRHFKERVKQENVVRTFGSPDDLAKEVAIATNRIINTPMYKVTEPPRDCRRVF